MADRVRLLGRPGVMSDLLARVLAAHGMHVEASTAGSPDSVEADVLLLVSPGPAEWRAIDAFAGGVVAVVERRPGDDEVIEAVLAGCDAVLHLDTSPAELVATVHAVRRRHTLLSPAQVRLLAEWARAQVSTRQAAKRDVRLTLREQAILRSAERGQSVKQTARSLGISPKTVENLQTRLFRKLGASNRAHAVALANGFGLLSDHDLLAS
jgi:DNA-binding NarL/FixJ family response regulator